jgi:hypothetical protein
VLVKAATVWVVQSFGNDGRPGCCTRNWKARPAALKNRREGRVTVHQFFSYTSAKLVREYQQRNMVSTTQVQGREL